MDEVKRLVDEYRMRATAAAPSKVHLLMDLERIRDPRVVPFLLKVLEDRLEIESVRIHVLKQLRNGDGLVAPYERPRVAKSLSDILVDNRTVELRLEAALALGELTQIDGVLATLTKVALARDESIDLRYAAFTSLERAGPTPESIALMRLISSDETLGMSARGVMSAWYVV
jgi:hypothetical protein